MTSYRIKLSAAKGRRLLIEQALQAGWKLTKPNENTVTLTPRYHRISHQIHQASTDRLDGALHRPILRSYRLAKLSRDDALIYAGTGGFAPQ